MKITDKNGELIRPERAGNVRESRPAQAGEASTKPVAGVERTDKVEISDAGREKAALMDTAATSESSAALSPERIAEIRKRVLEGAYDSAEVVDAIARRIVDRGDL
jgi:negative regulator of flagellin synthesis FlgM